jgi:hypothetical protein
MLSFELGAILTVGNVTSCHILLISTNNINKAIVIKPYIAETRRINKKFWEELIAYFPLI